MDCRSCGACCKHGGEVVVYNDETTPRYRTCSVRNVIGFASFEADELRRMKRGPNGACVALRGEVGTAVSCRIYERRPEVCRKFQPGSKECLVARTKAGLENV